MSERPPLDPTVDIPPSGDELDAGLAAAFGQLQPASGSVLEALSVGLPSVPRILLREPESFGGSPIVRPSSEEMPDKQNAGTRLQLHGEIARGGMGAVLKGRDVDLGRDVAVKVLLEKHLGKTEMLQRFVEEAQISGQLQHPGIAPVYELGQFVDKRPYFTMKLVKGKTLATLLAARKSAQEELPRYVGIFAQICQTLAYAHARGVIHRDLKPSNVMVGAFGEVQVMDWGLAKVLKEGGIADEQKAQERAEVTVIHTQRSEGSSTMEADAHTRTGTVLGTPAFMAPEQARGQVELVDERADVFGLGAILYAILTGQPPYVGKPEEIAYKARKAKLKDAFARLEGCGADGELIALAKRCLAAELWERPRHAGEVAQQVTAYQQSVAERLRQAELAETEARARAEEESKTRAEAEARLSAERQAQRMTLGLAVAVLLALTLGGGGWLYLKNERDHRQAQLSRDVNEAVNKATSLREQARTASAGGAALFAQAREQAQRALALVESGPADDTLKNLVLQMQTELDEEEKDRRLIAALDEARLAQAETLSENRFAPERAVPKFREAFRAYGLPSGEGEPKVAAERIRQRPAAVQQAILAALDEWDDLAGNPEYKITEPHREWLRAVQEAAEPDDAWGRKLRSARRESDAGKRQAALETLAKSAKVAEVPARALTRLARQLGQPQAAELLRRTQQHYPADFWVNHNLGEVLQKVMPPEREEAVRFLTAAVALRPESPGALLNLGLALYHKGQLDEAIASYKKAIELDPKYAAAHNNLGNALKDKGQLDEAIACYKKAIELDPKYAIAHINLGAELKDKGQLDEAIACFEKAIELDPKLAPTHSNLGVVLGAKGQLDAAIACFEKAIALDSKFAPAHSNLGTALYHKGQLDEAIISYKKAIALDPKDANAHYNLGVALKDKGQLDEAIACYKKAIELDPKYAMAHNNLGDVLKDKGQLDEAIACYKKAIELDPKCAMAHNGLGVEARDKGQLDEAIAYFKKAIALDPKVAHAHNNLADILANAADAKLRDPVQAVALAKKATELYPKSWMGWGTLGEACYRTGQWQEAITALDKALALLKSDNAEAFLFLAMAHHRAGHKDEAQKWYDKGIAWMNKHATKDPTLLRYRNEAASVLGRK